MAWYAALELQTLGGAPVGDALADKVLLVVNVASQCGYTPQYTGLVALHRELAAQGFAVVGVPCNQFGAQEPGSAEEIASFCKVRYDVDFPLLAKQDVNGAARSALYQHLVASPAGGGRDVRWNFEKFVVGKDGAVRARFGSGTRPDDHALRAALAEALAG